jgi:type VI secretion system protein ImpE
MTAEELFREGRLDDAIQAQVQVVKKSPADQDARFLLFALLCFAGDLERAERHLDALSTQDQVLQRGSLLYRSLLSSETERRKVFEHGARPVLPPDPPANVEPRLRALAHLRAGDPAAAGKCIDEAVAATSAIAGSLGGEPFDQIRDYDDLLGSVLEVFAGGRYLWLPFENIRSLEIAEPATALDTLWAPASLRDKGGEEARVHLPVLYPGSHAHAEGALRLGRQSAWEERGELYVGAGQKVLLTARGEETAEHALLSVRSLELQAVN